MPKSKLNEELAQLLSAKVCPGEDEKYAIQLKQIADKIAEIEVANKQSKFFKALADKTRLRILKLLEVREMCVCDITVALSLTQPTTSHHLGILKNAELVKERKERKWVFYRIADPKLIEGLHKLSIL
jgi:ArsR family transcriptional regulator